jgi:hypothetical protein
MKLAELIARIVNAIIDAINRGKKADAANNPADAIANGGSVLKSDKSFAELADEPRRDPAK